MNTTYYVTMWNFQFWVIGIRKKEFIAFQLVDEIIAYQNTLWICILAKRKKERKEKGKKDIQLKLFL